jgi:AcrR family transcriptional regulator
MRVIAARGYDSVRLRDIAAEAGVTTGMIQYYFDSREDLLIAAMERLGLLQIEKWYKLRDVDSDPWTRLCAFIEPPEDESADRSAAWLEFCASSARNDRIRDVLRVVYHKWRVLVQETVEDGIRQKRFSPTLSPVDLAETLILLLDGSDIGVGSRAGNLAPAEVDTLTVAVMGQLVGIK